MRWTDATSTDWDEEYIITATSGENYIDKEYKVKYFDDNYEWMIEGWNKPYLILLNLQIMKIVIPRARSLIQYQLKYPNHL